MAHQLLLHGPNLNLLGTREPEVYGRTTLAQIDAALVDRAQAAGHTLDCLQSNAEHVLVERIHAAREDGMAADADRLISELASQTANPPVAAQPPYGRAVVSKG